MLSERVSRLRGPQLGGRPRATPAHAQRVGRLPGLHRSIRRDREPLRLFARLPAHPGARRRGGRCLMPADTDDTDWDTVGFVRASDYRTCVLDPLTDGPATPTTVGECIDLELTHVSRTIPELRKYDLVELVVPEERAKGRIYGLTDAGESLVGKI